MAVAGALCAALAAAGCGLGPGEDAGEAQLRVTRDFGAIEVLEPATAEFSESDTVLRLLDRSAEVTTRYSGGFVQSIEGIEGGQDEGRLVDWFYSVNGVELGEGAGEYDLRDGDRVWWDLRGWSTAMRMPTNVGAFPEPLVHGFEGERHPVELECLPPPGCGPLEAALEEAGVELGEGTGGAPIRILAGPWRLVRADDTARLIEDGPARSGVFADFVQGKRGWTLELLGETGAVAATAGRGAPLVAALRDEEAPPVWVVTGSDRRGATAAQRLVDEAVLAGKYAVGPGGKALPLR
jgi:hypothetical protein